MLGVATGTLCVWLTVRHTPRWAWPVAVVTILTLAIWALPTSHTDSDVATRDALTTSLSLVAQVMLGRMWVGSWAFWITADLVHRPLYLHQGLTLTAALYLLFFGLALVGLRQWWRAREETPTTVVVCERPVAA
ncbi:MAG: nicotinamide mononucleotide transporter family protein [Terracoccus sp.]